MGPGGKEIKISGRIYIPASCIIIIISQHGKNMDPEME